MGKERARKKLRFEFAGSSPEFQILGKEFVKICQNHKLDLQGMQIVDQIYQEWLGMWGRTEEKANVCFRLTLGYVNVLGIQKALLEISVRYAEVSPASRVGKFAKKAEYN